MTPEKPQTFRTIEAGRGIAALLVVFFHAGASIFVAPKYWQTDAFERVAGWGYAGVFFFFVLSGFIIVHVHLRDIGRPSRLGHYTLRRLVRIYPLYWLVLAALLAAVALGFSAPITAGGLASSIALIGADNRASLVAVAWTLYHEILFYLAFAAWIVSPRLGLAVIAIWLTAIIAGLAGLAVPVPGYVAAPVNLLFLYGAGAWALSRRPLPTVVIPLAALAFVAVGIDVVLWHSLATSVSEQLFGISAAAGIAAIVSRERRRPVTVPRPLLLLGAASYSIYLVHFPVLALLAKAAVRFGLIDTVPAIVSLLAVVGLAVAAGIAVHKLVERPLLAAINTRAFARRD